MRKKRSKLVPSAAPQQHNGKLPNVKYTRDELSNLLLIYYMIRDCIEGEPAIKGLIGASSGPATYVTGSGDVTSSDLMSNIVLSRARRYLPQPNADDKSDANLERYRAYVQRAVFYNFTARTLDGMVGQVYLIPPVVTVPSELDSLLKDSDGQGLTLIQLSKRAVRDAMAYGRSGILADYPQLNRAVTRAEIDSGEVSPILTIYAPWNIINWRCVKREGKTVLTLLVLRETVHDESDDGFEISAYEQYRVLKLTDDGVYTVQIYSPDNQNGYIGDDVVTPKDASGKTFDAIPFTFIGSQNNDAAVDKPPLYDLASLNLAHYRNSADYEEASFLVGQPTPIFTGLSEDWVKNVLKGAVSLGSRASIPLPVGGDAKLLQADPNNMPSEAMKHKEDQALSIGAKLVIQKRIQRTATETLTDASSESSVLANVAENVSNAFEFALKIAARFVGANDSKIKFQLNKEFELNRMTADDQSKLVANWQKGAITFGEMREGLRKSGVATLDDKEAQDTIQKEMAMGLTTGPVADPFGTTEPAAPNPKSDPAGHATRPATRGA